MAHDAFPISLMSHAAIIDPISLITLPKFMNCMKGFVFVICTLGGRSCFHVIQDFDKILNILIQDDLLVRRYKQTSEYLAVRIHNRDVLDHIGFRSIQCETDAM